MAVTAETLRFQRDLRRALAAITDRHQRELVRAWALSWNEIQPDLTAVLLDMLTAGEKVTRAQMLRSERLRRVLQHIADSLTQLAADAGVTLTADLQAVVDAAGGAQASVIDSQLPPGSPLADTGTWARIDPRQVDAIVQRSTEQITSLLRPLSAEATAAVRAELIRGVAAGSNPREVARRIVARVRGRFNGGLTRAMTIARTEILSAHREAARLAREQHLDVLAGWRWMCDLSTRTCPACLAKHGTMHPPAQAGPDGHPNCRCAAVPVTKSWADLGVDGMAEPPDLFPDARTWFDALPAADQLTIMGPERLALLQSGVIGWDDLATVRRNSGWRDSWQVTPVRDLRRRTAAA